MSKQLFWQATKAIDGSDASKSITFLAAHEDGDLTAKIATLMWAYAPTAADHVYAHTLALRRLKDFLGLLSDAFHYDEGTEVEVECLRDLLEASKFLLWNRTDLWSDETDSKYWTSYEYWKRKSEADNWDGLSCYAARPLLSTLLPALIRALRRYKDVVLDGKYYWAHRNPEFLRLVHHAVLPEEYDKDALINWSEKHEHTVGIREYLTDNFIREARMPKTTKKAKRNSARVEPSATAPRRSLTTRSR